MSRDGRVRVTFLRVASTLLALGGVATLLSCGSPGGSAPGLAGAAGVTPATTAAAQISPAVTVSRSTAATPSATPSVSYRTVTLARPVPFKRTTVRDPSLARGTTRVRTRGVAGVERLTYTVTVVDGVQTSRRLVRRVTVRAPVTQVTVIGTKQRSSCDPNYSGACVPIASDVDCAGGSGNGPAYVQGPVKVIGVDIYGLDSDHDGIGCE